LDYSIHKIFRDVGNINFISNVIGRKSTKFIICNGLVCFKLNLGRLGRSNQVKSKKDLVARELFQDKGGDQKR